MRQRLDLLAGRIAETRDALANYRHEVPRLFLVEVEYELQMTEAEANGRALLDELAPARSRIWPRGTQDEPAPRRGCCEHTRRG